MIFAFENAQQPCLLPGTPASPGDLLIQPSLQLTPRELDLRTSTAPGKAQS